MKKKLPIILIVSLLITSISFFALWQYEKHSKKDLHYIRDVGIHDCLDNFSRYRDTGWEGSYNYALGGLGQVLSVSSFLSQKAGMDMYVFDLYYIYGIFVSYPEVGKEYINEIIEVFDMLEKDVNSLDAHHKIHDLRSKIQHR